MFNIRLKELRNQRNMTQDELGNILNVSGKTIGTWERDSRQPNIETINALANFFGVSTDYLLGHKGSHSMLGVKVRDLRKEQRLSQTELGKKLGVSQTTVTAWETGRAEPTSTYITKLADFFNVSTDYLLGRESARKANYNDEMLKMSADNKIIMSQNLKRLMKFKGIDRRKLASDLNIKYTTLTDWINGNSYPRIDKIGLLANYFNVSKSELIEEHVEVDDGKLEEMLSNAISFEGHPITKNDKALLKDWLKVYYKNKSNNSLD